jgi:hypothetical protein
MKTDINFYHIPLNFSYNYECFRQICTENQNTHFIYNNLLFFIDMDMSYTRVLHIEVAYRVPHK